MFQKYVLDRKGIIKISSDIVAQFEVTKTYIINSPISYVENVDFDSL